MGNQEHWMGCERVCWVRWEAAVQTKKLGESSARSQMFVPGDSHQLPNSAPHLGLNQSKCSWFHLKGLGFESATGPRKDVFSLV